MARKKAKVLIPGQTLLFTPPPPKGVTASMKSFMVPFVRGYVVNVRKNPPLQRQFRKQLFTAFDVEFRLARLIDEEEKVFKLRVRRRRMKFIWPTLLWMTDLFRYRRTNHGLWRPIDVDAIDFDKKGPRPLPKPLGRAKGAPIRGALKKAPNSSEQASLRSRSSSPVDSAKGAPADAPKSPVKRSPSSSRSDIPSSPLPYSSLSPSPSRSPSSSHSSQSPSHASSSSSASRSSSSSCEDEDERPFCPRTNPDFSKVHPDALGHAYAEYLAERPLDPEDHRAVCKIVADMWRD